MDLMDRDGWLKGVAVRLNEIQAELHTGRKYPSLRFAFGSIQLNESCLCLRAKYLAFHCPVFG